MRKFISCLAHNPKKIKKYAVTKSAYLLDTFPAYCGGPCTLLPSEYIKTGFEIAKNTYPGSFHHDDVLFTGVIRIKSGAPDPVNVNGICTHYNSEDKLENIRNGKISQRSFQVLYLKVTDSMLVFVGYCLMKDLLCSSIAMRIISPKIYA